MIATPNYYLRSTLRDAPLVDLDQSFRSGAVCENAGRTCRPVGLNSAISRGQLTGPIRRPIAG
jgi:hypothetical protein